MLGFLRRYQKFFFAIVAVVMIISMCFFGSYGGGAPKAKDSVAFKSIDGRPIKQSELMQMVFFLSSDQFDAAHSGGRWGNLLNDGVISQDILSTGLGHLLMTESRSVLESDIRTRAQREKNFQPYVHPNAQFLNASTVWNYYSPGINTHLTALKGVTDPLSNVALARRVQLYLEERAFPQEHLKQVLRQQEGQYNWVHADPSLYQRDLALFGYHTLEDWFGRNFVTLVAKFLIDVSVIAQEQGYKVSNEEAWSDLQQHAQVAFEHLQGVDASSTQLLERQLREMGLGRGEAVHLWKRVLLFRRLFQDVGRSALLDAFAVDKFRAFADETVAVEVYSLPEALQLRSGDDLMQFEAYLDAVSLEPGKRRVLPRHFRSVRHLARELVQRRYTLDVEQVSRASLAAKIALRDVWEWELAAENWERILKEFPAVGDAKSREERFNALNACTKATRAKIDAVAQQAICEAHPEWTRDALERAPVKRVEIALSAGGEPLPGIRDIERFRKALDSGMPLVYTEDGAITYRLSVVSRADEEEMLTFAEAKERGVLGKPQNWEERLKQVWTDAGDISGRPTEPTPEFCALHRFDAHLRAVQEDIESWLDAGQWSLVCEKREIKRSDREESSIDLFTLETDSWSPVVADGTRPAYFARVTAHVPGLAERQDATLPHLVLASEAQRHLMAQVLDEIRTRGGEDASIYRVARVD